MTDHSGPLPELLIRDIETLKVLSHPFRIKLLSQFGEGSTVKEAANSLGLAPQKLYYHVNLLEKHGLLEVVGTRMISGIVEKSYRITAERYVPAPDLLTVDADGTDLRFKTIRAMVDRVRDDLSQATKVAHDDGRKRRPNVALSQATIRPQDFEQVTRKLEELEGLLRDLGTACESSASATGLSIALFTALYENPNDETKNSG